MWEMIRILLPRAQQDKTEETNQQLMYFGQPGGGMEGLMEGDGGGGGG